MSRQHENELRIRKEITDAIQEETTKVIEYGLRGELFERKWNRGRYFPELCGMSNMYEAGTVCLHSNLPVIDEGLIKSYPTDSLIKALKRVTSFPDERFETMYWEGDVAGILKMSGRRKCRSLRSALINCRLTMPNNQEIPFHSPFHTRLRLYVMPIF